MMLRKALLGVLAVMVFSAEARAEAPDDITSKARAHFEAGRGMYNLGNYSEAIKQFSAGYDLVPKAQFLINLGQCYRKLGDLGNARAMYQKYLDTAPPGDPEREQITQIVGEIDRTLSEHPEQATPPPTTNLDAPVSSAVPTAVAISGSAPPPIERRSFIRRHWWIIPVAGVVAAGAAAAIIYYATRPPTQVDCAQASLGCIDTTH